MQTAAESPLSELFLPDFCAMRAVFGVVVIAQLLAFVLVLAGRGDFADPWLGLSLVSLFVQWVALTSAALLCLLRRRLAVAGNRAAAALSYGMLLAVTALISEIAYRLFMPDQAGDPHTLGGHAEFVFRNLAIVAIVAALVLRYFYVQFQWKRNLEAESESRLEALQARIRPHFLFNSMNTIASLTRSDPALAEQVVEDLADLFRVTLAEVRRLVALQDEIEHVRRYLNIEKLRLGERLGVDWALQDPPPALHLPALTLQPLLENAIYHGIEPLPAGGTIRVEGRAHEGEYRIAISNPRPRGSAEATRGSRMALDNVRQRLAAAFGGVDRMRVEEGDDQFKVELRVPLEGSA